MRILLAEFERFEISHDWHYVDDSEKTYDAIEAAMEEYADLFRTIPTSEISIGRVQVSKVPDIVRCDNVKKEKDEAN
jgi:hypothetical protein